jgi:diguanylate cyclase (GGDEF)-like protein
MTSRDVPRRVWLFAFAMAAVAGVLWSVAWRLPVRVEPIEVPWLAIAAGFLATQFLTAAVETGRHSHRLDLSVVPMLVGLCFVAPGQLLAARLLAMLVSLLFVRQRPIKVVLNLANTSLVFAVAVLVFEASRGGAGLVGPRFWLAANVATLAAYLASAVAVMAALSLWDKQFRFSPSFIAAGAAMNFANVGLAIITIDVLLVDWRGVWLVIAALVTLWAIYRRFLQFRQRHANLQLIHRFTQTVSGATDTDDVVSQSLTLAQEMLRCEAVELILPTVDGIVIHKLSDEEIVTQRVAVDQTSLEEILLDSGEARLIRKGHRDGLRELMGEHGWDDLLSVRVDVRGDVHGVLLVANRIVEKSTFDDGDLRLLEALGSQTAIALRASYLVERLRAEAADRAYQATHDSLTGLANRALLTERLNELLGAADRTSLVALFFIDLDGFKEVNDALGHHTGDRLLNAIAACMQRELGDRASIARLGGDEFALAVAGLQSLDEAKGLGAAIRDLIERPVVIDELTLEVRASVGVALAPVHGTDPSALFQRADIAMYAAKGQRTGVELYDAGQDNSSRRRLSLVGDLRHAIENGQLELHYQPQALGETGQVVAAEALARWRHAEFGWVGPDEFIPIAEQTGLMQPLTMWALRTGLAQLAKWRQTHPDLRISVNMSARSLMDASLAADVEALLDRCGLPAHALTLELTESSVMADPQRSLQQLLRLHEMGVRIAIDDFGTGYSSLSYLKRLPVDEVKIDKSFVIGMVTDADDAAIVRSTIDLAANLGLEVIAEGVEDARTWDLLVRLGCDAIQGYHLSRPLSADDMAEFLAHAQPVTRERAGVVELHRRLAPTRPLTAVAGG